MGGARLMETIPKTSGQAAMVESEVVAAGDRGQVLPSMAITSKEVENKVAASCFSKVDQDAIPNQITPPASADMSPNAAPITFGLNQLPSYTPGFSFTSASKVFSGSLNELASSFSSLSFSLPPTQDVAATVGGASSGSHPGLIGAASPAVATESTAPSQFHALHDTISHRNTHDHSISMPHWTPEYLGGMAKERHIIKETVDRILEHRSQPISAPCPALPISTANASQPMEDTFTCFPKLPFELRLKIWKEIDYQEPRKIELSWVGGFFEDSNSGTNTCMDPHSTPKSTSHILYR